MTNVNLPKFFAALTAAQIPANSRMTKQFPAQPTAVEGFRKVKLDCYTEEGLRQVQNLAVLHGVGIIVERYTEKA